MKFSLKSILCNISYTINLPEYLGPFGRNKIIVLMYHGIIESVPQNPIKNIYGYNITVRQFENQMAYLSTYCKVIKASEAIAGENISRDKKNVVITFDDGYRNNYTNAFPILFKYNLPALFSIPTAFVVDRVPLWNDVVEYSVAAINKRLARIKWKDIYLDFGLDTTIEKIEFYRWFLSKCVEIIQDKREQFISYVLRELDVSVDNDKMFEDPDYKPLSFQEIKEMADSKLVEFASHSVNHFVLSHVNENTLKDQLTSSKSAIENVTGLPCRYFCLPGGHYDNSVIDMMLNVGFEKIFSSDRSELDPENTVNVIGRYCVTRFLSMPLFVDMVHGPIHRMRRK